MTLWPPPRADDGAMHAPHSPDDETRGERPPPADTLFGVLAHELRTPITTIYAGSAVLAHDDALLPAMRRTLAADVQAEAARLFRAVEDLLVLTRLEHGGLDLMREPVLLDRVVETAIRLESQRWPNLRITSRFATEVPPVAGDGTALAHALRNLIANAGWRASGGSLVIAVQDGPGGVVCRLLDRTGTLHPDDLPTLFDLPSVDPRPGSSSPGIAMYVAARLVEAMGGRITAHALADGVIEILIVLPHDGSVTIA